MNDTAIQRIITLRHRLHAIAEPSMHEIKTKETLLAFLCEHTTAECIDCGTWFYAVRRSSVPGAKTIAFRADMDAIVHADTGLPFHGCGHDGHAAAVAGLALLTEGMALDKTVVFLFQPGEETGEGAVLCREVIRWEHIDEIYGCHSIPGYPMGEILWRREVFACASRGMILSFHGQQCHAAYPETGRNPASAISRTLTALDAPADPTVMGYRGMVLATVCGVRIGAKAFGVSAGDGEIFLTVRAHYEDALCRLAEAIEAQARVFCEEDGIALSVSFVDVFPDTVCDSETADAFYARMQQRQLPIRVLDEPMRWSEDFGWYCRETKGVFFGIGAGEDSPALHTDDFCYNDALIRRTEEIFLTLCQT